MCMNVQNFTTQSNSEPAENDQKNYYPLILTNKFYFSEESLCNFWNTGQEKYRYPSN
jgi:hypothetical protein